MKTIISLLLVIMLSQLSFGQQKTKVDKKYLVTEYNIDFSKQYIYFKLDGWIMIDDSIFDNSRSKQPIYFTSDLSGITISDICKRKKYEFVRFIKFENKTIIQLKMLERFKPETPITNRYVPFNFTIDTSKIFIPNN